MAASSRCSTDPSLISNMRYVEGRGLAEAAVQSMFRFPDARYVHVQCGVVRCSSYPCSKVGGRTHPEGPSWRRGMHQAVMTSTFGPLAKL